MRSKISAVLIFLFCIGFIVLYPQQSESKIAKKLPKRLVDEADFKSKSFSEKYRVVEPGQIYFDVDVKNRNAILYFNAHPIYRFKVRVVDYESEKLSIAGKEYVLTGNTDQRIIIDKAVKKVFVKKKESPGALIRAPFSKITVERTPNKKYRCLIRDKVKMLLEVNYSENGKKSADFYFKGIFVFSLDVEFLKTRGRVNPNVLILKGNAGDELALNPSRKTLFFRSGHPRVTWAKVEEI